MEWNGMENNDLFTRTTQIKSSIIHCAFFKKRTKKHNVALYFLNKIYVYVVGVLRWQGKYE